MCDGDMQKFSILDLHPQSMIAKVCCIGFISKNKFMQYIMYVLTAIPLEAFKISCRTGHHALLVGYTQKPERRLFL